MDRRLPIALGAAAVVLAGCGGSSSSHSTAAPATTGTTSGGAGAAAFVLPAPTPVAHWSADSDNDVVVHGRLLAGGAPVRGAAVRVGSFVVPQRTDANGGFTYALDATRLHRYRVTVAAADGATAGGAPLSSSLRARLLATTGAVAAAYRIRALHLATDARGNPVLTGRISYADGTPPPKVALLSYRLTGRVVDAHGRPVAGARVSTRTLDRDFWTVSEPTGADGRYVSVFVASSESGGDPVAFQVRVARGDLVWQFLPEENVVFRRLQSATMDIALPPANYPLALPLPTSYPGALYSGVAVGASVDGTPVVPLAATWPDARGAFRLVLPPATRGHTVSLWQNLVTAFEPTPATAGGAIPASAWPRSLPDEAPRQLASLAVR